jgi:antitoxin component YwqK of YwqJK toxin-antitoxin module
MKNLVSPIALFLLMMMCLSCNIQRDDALTIKREQPVSKIILPLSDSTRIEIRLNDNHSIKSITQYKKSEFNGEQLNFHQNGRLHKKFEAWENIYHGHNYEFFESGALAADNFFCNSYPCTYGAEYWDGPHGIMKKSIHYGTKGEIVRIKFFDSSGNFIKDSTP